MYTVDEISMEPENMEDNQFLNDLDMGYIGHSKPAVRVLRDKGRVLWVVQDDGSVKPQYVPEDEIADYSETYGDNSAADPSEAYA